MVTCIMLTKHEVLIPPVFFHLESSLREELLERTSEKAEVESAGGWGLLKGNQWLLSSKKKGPIFMGGYLGGKGVTVGWFYGLCSFEI